MAIEITVDYKIAFESLPGSFLILQPNTPFFTILAVSEELLAAGGWHQETLAGKSIFDVYDGPTPFVTYVQDLRSGLERALVEKKVQQLTVRPYVSSTTSQGIDERYYIANVKPVCDNVGTVLYLIFATTDITSQILAERKRFTLNEVQTAYDLFMQAPVAICIVKGADYVVELANEGMLQFLGRTPDIAGKPIIESLPEAKQQGLMGILDHVYKTGETFHTTSFPGTIVINDIRELRYFDLVFKPYYQNPNEATVTHIFCAAHNVTEQVFSRKKVEESEQQVRTFIESAPFPIGVYIGKELRIQFANHAMLHAWGKGDDVIGKLFSDILPELDIQQVFSHVDRVFQSGKPFHAKNQPLNLHVNGQLSTYYYDYSFTPLFDMEGSVYGIMNTAADVTEVNVANRRIEESEKNLRNIILQAPVAMAIFRGPQYIVEIANERMFQLLGRPLADILHKPLFAGLPEAKHQGFEELLSKVYETGETFSAYALPVTLPRDGSVVTVYVNFVYEAFREGDGTISGIMVVATDVTQQVIATKQIEEAEERARLAVDSAELGTYEVNLLTNVIVASPRMAEIFDVKKDSDRGRYITAIHPEDQQTREDAYARSVETGRLEYEARVIHQDGVVHWLRVKGRIYLNPDRTPVRLLGVVQDITEQKEFSEALRRKVAERTAELARANEHLGHMNKELEEFTYAASHDMQEPLRKVQTFCSFLLQHHSKQLDDQGKNYVKKIGSSARRMQNMIDDLLNYSHQVRDAQLFVPTDLNKIIEEIEADLELNIQKKEATIRKDVFPQITAIPGQMNQLFFNLFSNALKFSRSEVPVQIDISVTAATEDELSKQGIQKELPYIKIVFADNGIGFSQEYAHQIFSLFKRLHGKSEYEGTGIGLGLCLKIVQGHKGAIWAEAEVGKGATFYILLPKEMRDVSQ